MNRSRLVRLVGREGRWTGPKERNMSFIDDTYYDSFDCEVCIEEDPALAAYEAMLELGMTPACTSSKYQPDPNDDIPL